MTTIDLNPIYNSSIGIDPIASLLNSTFNNEQSTTQYPPYNIESNENDRYIITLAVAGYDKSELDVQVERNVLTIRGQKQAGTDDSKYLYQGIVVKPFERRFTLAKYVDVSSADFNNGLLTINLIKEMPDEMKPKSIKVNQSNSQVIEHQSNEPKE